ncbi:MAG: hypothetical protein ACRD2G_00705 [Terriglobia bacterium]
MKRIIAFIALIVLCGSLAFAQTGPGNPGPVPQSPGNPPSGPETGNPPAPYPVPKEPLPNPPKPHPAPKPKQPNPYPECLLRSRRSRFQRG